MSEKYFNPLSQEETDREMAELEREHYRDDLSEEITRLRAEVDELRTWSRDAKTMIQKVRRAVLMDIWANALPGGEDDTWAEDWDRALNELVATCPSGEVSHD